MPLRSVTLVALAVLLGLRTGPSIALAQDFSEDSTALPGVQFGQLDWGDFDADGDLDLAFSGLSNAGVRACDIYRNDAGTFVPIGAGLLDVAQGDLRWGDYDGDGDLDLAVSGLTSTTQYKCSVFRNDNGTFVDIGAGLAGVYLSSLDWGDMDNDGDLDLLAIGSTVSGTSLFLYRNIGNDMFVPVTTALPGMTKGSAAWGDYDGDGDLDLLLTGESSSFMPRTFLFRNDGADVFTQVAAGFFPLFAGRAVWGDYDRDGDLDILAVGSDSSGVAVHSFVYRNDGGDLFVDIGATLDGAGEGGAAEWADADHDGDLDVLLMARNFHETVLHYHQGDSTFVPAADILPDGCCGDIAWGDFDADGAVDFALSVTLLNHSGVFRNVLPGSNTLPSPPDSLSALVVGSAVELHWNSGADAETGAAGLSYNVRVGTAPGLGDVMPAMSRADGRRMIPDLGNVDQNHAWKLVDLPPGVYFWSVQSIDAEYAGSPFAAEASFAVGDACPVSLTGDVDYSDALTSADVIYLVNYVFKGGPAPLPCAAAGDVNCDGKVVSADVIGLVNHIFKSGPAPCDVCNLIPATWTCP